MVVAAGSAPVRAVIIGASGRMGAELLRAARAWPGLTVSGAIAAPGSAALGRDAGELAGTAPWGVAVSADLAAALAQADVALDFSTAAAAPAHLAAARRAKKPLLLGTTGGAASLEAELTAAAREIAVLAAANTSLGAALLTELVRRAAAALPREFDIDVLEAHHRSKKDAPSGTALTLVAALQAGRGGAAGTARPGAEIAVQSVRAGDIVGEHTVRFSGPGEELSFSHRASERGIFARGALAAALWLQSRPPGRYGMADVLGFKTGT